MSDQDGISTNMLKNTAAPLITKLFNVSLTTGMLPYLSGRNLNVIVPIPMLQTTDPFLYYNYIKV